MWLHRAAILMLLAGALAAGEALALPWHLTDHAVLQRDRPLAIAGRAAPGAAVVLAIAGLRAEAVAGADGAWTATLPAMPAGGPHVLEATAGAERLRVEDVLVGDVWLCSGQSNMGWTISSAPDGERRQREVAGARLRLLKVRASRADRPLSHPGDGQRGWSLPEGEALAGFSAVALSFGRNLQLGGLDVPIGLVQSHRAGTFGEAWMPLPAVEAMPGGVEILARWRWFDEQRPRLIEESERAHAAWKQSHGERFQRWKPTPIGGPFTPHEPSGPPMPDSALRPAVLWNGQIAPLTGLAIRGVVWYQGESNSDRAWHYRHLLAALVASWRAAWNQPALPFIVAQVPEYETDTCPYDWQDQGAWEVLRESQALVGATVPGVATVPLLGLGERADIHPRRKWEAGERLARAALATVYGRDLPWSGPRVAGWKREGGRIVLTLSAVGSGAATLDGGPVRGFQLAGADRRFVAAMAEITAPGTIAVSVSSVPEPVAVRYAWDDDPPFNLVCSAGLPMGPWRSDDWSVPTQDVVMPLSRTWPKEP